MRRILLGGILGALVVALAASSYAECVCTECAADPVFIQRDQRRPEQLDYLLQLMRERASFNPRTAAIVLKGDEATARVEL